MNATSSSSSVEESTARDLLCLIPLLLASVEGASGGPGSLVVSMAEEELKSCGSFRWESLILLPLLPRTLSKKPLLRLGVVIGGCSCREEADCGFS